MKPSCFIPRGPGPTIVAVERREASVADATQGASQAPAGVRHSPADGCRCTRAPVGAPLPSLSEEGAVQTSEGLMPRENDDACLKDQRGPL